MAVSVEISVFTLLGLWASKMEQILCSDCSQGSLLGNKVDKANVSTVQGIYIMNQSNHHDGKTHINAGLIIWISIQNEVPVLIIIILNACNNIKNNLIIFIISNIIGEIVILKYYFWSV